MNIKFLGVGGMFSDLSKGQSNMLLEEGGEYLMFDFGMYAPLMLTENNIGLDKISALYISHIHPDHSSGVSYLAFYRYFVSSDKPDNRPKLFVSSDLIGDLWNKVLCGDLDSINGKVCHLTDYFDCQRISKNKNFTWQGVKFTPVTLPHVNAGFSIKHSYGLFIENPKTEKKAFITSDCIFCPDLVESFYQKSDIIFSDCETTEGRSRVHPNWRDLQTLPEEIKQKMWLYHYSKEIEMPGFAGFVQKGQTFSI